MGYASLLARRRIRASTTPDPVDPEISISVPFLSGLVVQGADLTRTVTLTRAGGYEGDVALAVAGLPTGVTGAFSNPTLTGATLTSVLTLTAAADAPVVASDPFTITASGAGVAADVLAMTLTVTDLAHYGSALLPFVTPTYTPSNALGAGTNHTPGTAEGLWNLTHGAALAGQFLEAGDTITVQRGTCYTDATYPQQIFPYIAGSDVNPIRVITSNTAVIATPGRRITTASRHATAHFRCVFGDVAPLRVDRGAQGYQFVGIQADSGTTAVAPCFAVVIAGAFTEGDYNSGATYSAGAHIGRYISLQNGNTNHAQTDAAWWRPVVLADLADKIVFDRCDFAGTTVGARCRFALLAHTREMVVTGSILYTEGGGSDNEDKALGGTSCRGPWLIDNTQLTASAINFLVGGGVPYSDDMVLLDATFRRCWIVKPPHMVPSLPEFDGAPRMHKNLWEVKCGVRVLLEDSILENHLDYFQSQYYALVVKCSNGSDGGPGSTSFPTAETGHVTMRNLLLRNVNGILGIAASNTGGSGIDLPPPVHDVSMYHIWTETKHGAINQTPGLRAWQFQIPAEVENLHVEHVTLVGDNTSDIRTLQNTNEDGLIPNGLVLRNNLLTYGGNYGGVGSSGLQDRGIDQFAGAGSSASGNHIYNENGVSIPGGKYPNGQLTVENNAAAMYVNYGAGNYRTAAALAGTGYGGRTPGADIDTIESLTAGCVSGVWT